MLVNQWTFTRGVLWSGGRANSASSGTWFPETAAMVSDWRDALYVWNLNKNSIIYFL